MLVSDVRLGTILDQHQVMTSGQFGDFDQIASTAHQMSDHDSPRLRRDLGFNFVDRRGKCLGVNIGPDDFKPMSAGNPRHVANRQTGENQL